MKKKRTVKSKSPAEIRLTDFLVALIFFNSNAEKTDKSNKL